MTPHLANAYSHLHSQFHTLSVVISSILANPHTPLALRILILTFIQGIREILPSHCKCEIEAAEAKAVIGACPALYQDKENLLTGAPRQSFIRRRSAK